MTHILIMEDDEDQLELVSDFLTDEGYQVTTAQNATEAWEILMTQDIDLLISDLMVRGKDGYAGDGGLSLIGRMRVKGRPGPEKRLEKLPILVMTGSSVAMPAVDIQTLSEEMGANKVLRKPVQQAKLLSAVRMLLEKS